MQGDIRDSGLIPGLGRSPGGGDGDSLDRGAFLATIHGVAESDTTEQLSLFSHDSYIH